MQDGGGRNFGDGAQQKVTAASWDCVQSLRTTTPAYGSQLGGRMPLSFHRWACCIAIGIPGLCVVDVGLQMSQRTCVAFTWVLGIRGPVLSFVW